MKPASCDSESVEATNENALPVEFLINSKPLLRGKRQVLGDKTPLKDSSMKRNSNVAFSPSPHTKSPLKQVLSTPAPSTHPVLRDITNSAQSLKNPLDLFPVTSTVKRSRRRLQKKLKEAAPEVIKSFEDENERQEELIPSKLATTVFPSSDAEVDREIEHPTGALPEAEDELKGPSQIIPQLTDFSKNLTAETEGEFEKRCVIEVVDVPFVLPEDCE